MKQENIQYRLNRANETYQDAVFLFERGSLNSSINRLYYAVFYATIALLLANDIEVKSHNGVKQKLGEEFIAKGKLSKIHAKTFNILSDFRHKGDYDDLFDFETEMVERLIDPVKEFIDAINQLIR
ncbi:MAG: HEPN domain-containing protein [Bacteroidota bacterium]|nr:HEPN domain-containing protein [Bacteroidota bacterium]